MPRHVMLNNIAHKDLRVITRYGAEFGDNVGTVMTVPTEFADMQREYPIFFRKDPNTGEFMSVALLGFAQGREPVSRRARLECGLRTRRDRPRALPDRLPGATGRRGAAEGARDPRRSRKPAHQQDARASAVFLPQGGNSRYLDRVASHPQRHQSGTRGQQGHVRGIHGGGPHRAAEARDQDSMQKSSTTCSACTRSISRSSRISSAETLHKLHRAGFLQGAFLVANSLEQRAAAHRAQGRVAQRQAATAS